LETARTLKASMEHFILLPTHVFAYTPTRTLSYHGRVGVLAMELSEKLLKRVHSD